MASGEVCVNTMKRGVLATGVLFYIEAEMCKVNDRNWQCLPACVEDLPGDK